MKRFSSGGCYADITPNERAIANGQRSFVSFLLLQLSNVIIISIIVTLIIIIRAAGCSYKITLHMDFLKLIKLHRFLLFITVFTSFIRGVPNL